MTTRALMLTGALAAMAGCGGGTSYKVAGNSLTVMDKGYYYTDGTDYCMTGSLGQIMLDFVDYNFICDPQHAPQRDDNAPHNELRIILAVGRQDQGYPVHPNFKLPFDSTLVGEQPDCNNGKGDAIVAEFLHYAGAMQPPTIQYATSAHLQFTQWDPNRMTTQKGNFDLKFGADEVKDNFAIDACN